MANSNDVWHAKTTLGLLAAFLRNVCQQEGWPNYIQEIIIGATIVVAVAIDSRARQRA